MLFKRRPKWPELQLTQRQLAALARRPERRAKKLREKLPLLAELIEPETIDFESEIDRRKDMEARTEREWRDRDAKDWREVRAEFFAASPEVQLKTAIHWAFWCQRHCPANAGNLRYVLRQYSKPWVRANQNIPKVRVRQAWLDLLRDAKQGKAGQQDQLI